MEMAPVVVRPDAYVLPPPTVVYQLDEEGLIIALCPAIEKLPGMLLYAEPQVANACTILIQQYHAAVGIITPELPPLHDAYKRLAKAQNDLVLEMRRDVFRWPIFLYCGRSRVAPVDPSAK